MAALSLVAAFSFASAQPALATCGDADNNGSIAAGDALRVLKAAVNTIQCELCVCDSNNNGTITAPDALLVLKKGVGQPVNLNCPGCIKNCGSVAAPACDGDCDPGLVCAENPDDPGYCECLSPCQLAAAPQCGESCAGSEVPDGECINGHFAVGEDSQDRCLCLPVGTVSCEDSSAPACGGVCSPGHLCTSKGESCLCDPLPAKPACQNSSSPVCDGTCDTGKICHVDGESCVCVDDTTGGDNACENAADPECGAPCGSGRVCVRDFLGGCSCAEPCEASSAPACGGKCNDDGTTCVAGTVTVGESVVNYCTCVPQN